MEYKLLITKDAENDINDIILYIVNELENSDCRRKHFRRN